MIHAIGEKTPMACVCFWRKECVRLRKKISMLKYEDITFQEGYKELLIIANLEV